MLLHAAIDVLRADDAGCRGDSCSSYRINATHPTTACNMPVLDVGAAGLSLDALALRLAGATTPLLLRGIGDIPGWLAQATALGNRSALLAAFGDEEVKLSVATLLSHGPESTKLDGEILRFMRDEWGAVGGSLLGRSVERQARAGEARPQVTLGAWLSALREGTAPPDAYVFQNISRGRVAQALAPLHALWRDAAVAHVARRQRSAWVGADPPALMRLGVGGSGSGAPFHDHEVLALNLAFAGRKRWLIARPCRPSCRIPFYQSGAAVYHPARLLREAHLPAAALRALGGGGDTWDCTQHPGEAVFVPARFLHATINLDESVAVAVQCDDGADPRAGLSSELNALIVLANGAAAEQGACGVAWTSPFGEGVGRREALAMLAALPNSFRGDPAVYLNRPTRDGNAPVDVAVRLGSARVAAAMAAQGARFLPRHLADARRRGHAALAALISISAQTP